MGGGLRSLRDDTLSLLLRPAGDAGDATCTPAWVTRGVACTLAARLPAGLRACSCVM